MINAGSLLWKVLLADAVLMVLALLFLSPEYRSNMLIILTGVMVANLVLVGFLVGTKNRSLTRRIQAITVAARSLSRVDLAARVESEGSDELSRLAHAINEMRDHMDWQWSRIDRQRQTLGSLVSQLREGVIVAGPDGRIVLINPEAQRLLQLQSPRPDGSFEGLAVEQCIPHHDLLAMLGGPDGPIDSDAGGAMKEVGSTSASRDRQILSELRLQLESPDGNISLLARVCEIVLPGGEGMARNEPTSRLGRLLVLTDVSELTRTIQVKVDFAANASHELRTPLSAILAAAETLRSIDVAQEPEATARFLEIIERHGRRMQAMVADLLDLSRLEGPSARFEPSRVRPRELFSELEALFHSEISAKRLTWSAHVAPECIEVMVNPDLLRIVLRNLIENAIRFTFPGGFVAAAARIENHEVLVEVADNGCGIPLEEQERVFERFYQVARSRSGEDRGTGLGLSIVRHAVAAMNAKIELQSEVDQGTRVRVRIPSALPSSDARSG